MSFSFKISRAFLTILSVIVLCSSTPCPIGDLVETASECLPYNKPGHLCCYLSSAIPKVSTCLQLSKYAYNGLKKFSMGGQLYDIECKQEEELMNPDYILPGSPCGVIEPANAEECQAFSTGKSSCCFFQHKTSAGCYNLGFTSKGKISLLGMSLDC